MPIKTKGFSKYDRKIKNFVKDTRKNFVKMAAPDIGDLIVSKITSGSSPVKGYGKYKKYSDSYAKVKGRKEPVDLLVTGKMLNSIKVLKEKGSLVIKFTSPIAKYHDGEGRVYRPMLPKRNQTFTVAIMKRLTTILKKAVKKASK